MIAPADYAARRDEHKPQTREGISIAAREMASSGLTDYDIAHVLRLDVQQIRRLIGCMDCGT